MNELDNIQEFLFYSSNDGSVKVQVLADAESETIWATQKAIAELFGVTKQTISYHLIKIFNSGELDSNTVVKEILITAQSGARGLSEEKIRSFDLSSRVSLVKYVRTIFENLGINRYFCP